MADIVKEMRGFEIDHEPDGWPAVRMRQVSALCDEVERLREIESAAKNLIAQKGRHNTEIAYKRLEDVLKTNRKEKTVTPITKDAIQEAMAAAEEATRQDLRGMYPRACWTLATTVQVLRDELASVEAERDTLRAFAQEVMECWPMGDLDGGMLQAAAVAHGLLVPETRNEPCGEGCNCADNIDAQEWSFGVVCYRKTPLLKGHNALAQGRGD